jgi:hypothetical protein
MPFGINSASEVFQKRMSQAFEDIDGVEVIVDDILIWRKDEAEHNDRLKQVLERVRQINLKLNKDKSRIQTTEVSYIGHKITRDGLKPDPEKVKAIHDITTPKDKKDLMRFLGMVNYLAKFVPSLSDLTQPLRELIKKDIEWHWTKTHENAFNRVKSSLMQDKLLKYYDVTEPVTLSVDSSSYGLGACLMQDSKPVSYASRSLNQAEKNYAQIEKELLAIVFGCKKYHQYIYGKPVTIETDHKPLEYLLKKPLIASPLRLQRMMLSLQQYDLSVYYKPGKTLYIADTLSRAPGTQTEPEQETSYVHTIQNLPVSTESIEKLKVETNKDTVLQKLLQQTKRGWPENRHSVDPEIHQLWSVRHEISEEDGLLLRGERLIVPRTLRTAMLTKIHENHLGIEKCKRRARDILYWPGMNDQIAQMVSRCETCTKYRNKQQKEPMRGHEIPDRTWQKVSMDLFQFGKDTYIVITDYYSKFFEVSKLTSVTASATIRHIKPHFARYGIPKEVISDNGTQFSCKEFKEFADKYEFKRTTSSPKYPQSNGLAERTVQTVKSIFVKAKEGNSDPNLAILALRNTPIDGIGLSPVQMLMGRRTRTRLPSNKALLVPKFDTAKIKPALQERQQKQKLYYDRNAKPLEPLKQGDNVKMRDEDKKVWLPATVTRVNEEPRSYTITSESGGEYRRNRRDLQKCQRDSRNDDETPQTSATENIPVTRSSLGKTIAPPSRYGFD